MTDRKEIAMTTFKIVTAVAGTGLAGVAVWLYVGFGAFLPWRENAEADRLSRLAGISEGQTVAEIGAGGGRFVVALAEKVGPAGRVFATELAGSTYQALAERTRSIGNITIVQAERMKTGLPDSCCDVVLMRNMYHHVANPAAFLDEAKRALRSNGRMVIVDFAPGALWFHGGRPADSATRRPGHGVSQAAARAELVQAGFRPEFEDPRWSPPMWMSMFRLSRR
jgi:SAM-dependent methyltransferase